MALDFPTAPTNGQKYPAPPVAGIPTYTWDGEKWTTVGGSIVSATPATATPLMDATPAVVGTTTKYAREDHVHPTDSTLLAKSDNLASVADATASRKSIYAAPFDAMAYSGLQVNGGMEVSQERGTAAISVASGFAPYVLDGWMLSTVGTQVLNGFQGTANVPAGFGAALQMTPTTANAAPAAGHLCVFQQRIEGYRISRLGWGTANAQPITISFWILTTRTGLFSGSLVSANNNLSYTFSFTVNAAATWEYKTVTVPGFTAGAWPNGNTTGVAISFAAMVGSTFTTAAGVWITGNFYGVPGSVNCVAATSDAFLITGVVVLPGNEAPSAARSPFIARPYDQELITCRRYWETAYGSFRQTSEATGRIGVHLSYAYKRAIPTLSNPQQGAINNSPGFEAFYGIGNSGAGVQWLSSANTAYYSYGFSSNVDARL